MSEAVSYLLKFANLDAAIVAGVALDAEVLELRPDGTVHEIAWDGDQPPQPAPEPTEAGGGLCDPSLLRAIAESLSRKAYGYPGCGITMPTPAPGPESDQS